MIYFKTSWAALGAALLVAACGGGDGGPLGSQDSAPARGVLMQTPPPRITSLSAADFTASLQASASGQGLLQLAGAPACGIDVQYIKYGTVGGANEVTNASGALIVPTGSDACAEHARAASAGCFSGYSGAPSFMATRTACSWASSSVSARNRSREHSVRSRRWWPACEGSKPW